MTGGKILDVSTLQAFAHERIAALLAVDAADRAAQTLIVPAAALVATLAGLSPAQTENLEHPLDVGVVLVDELTQATAPEIAATLAAAPQDLRADIPTAHAAYCARSREWTVITADPELWASAYPDIPTETLP